MLPDRVSNPGPLTYESGALPIALRGPAALEQILFLSPFWKWRYIQGGNQKETKISFLRKNGKHKKDVCVPIPYKLNVKIYPFLF